MGPRRSQFQVHILFILMSYCWEGQWMGQAHGLNVQLETFSSSDDQVERRIIVYRVHSSKATMDKCTNFYAYACGGVSDSQTSLPFVLDKKSWHEVLNTRLEELLDALIMSNDEPAIRKVKRQYEMCMNFEKRDREGTGSLKYLIRKDSDFPMIMHHDSWNPLSLRILGPQKYDPSLFSIRVWNKKIYIDKYDMSAYGRFLSNLKDVMEISHPVMYKSKIKQVFQHMALMDDVKEYAFDKDLDVVMHFRRDLHMILREKDMVHYLVTVADLQRLISINQTGWPQMDWESFLRYVFINVDEIEITSTTEVYVEKDYMIALRDLLLRYGQRCIANHIKLHFLETYMPESSTSLIDFTKELAVAAHDTIELNFRNISWNPCIYQPHMLRALNYMYLKEWFPKKSRDAALDMIKRLKDSLRHHVKATTMISNDDRQWAENQIDLMKVIIGSEEKYLHYNLLEPLYQYEVPDDHLFSVLNARRHFKEYEYSSLVYPKNTILAALPILEDKPYVSAEMGVINLPIGYLHRTSLSATLPKQISYATLGYKISLFMNELIIKKGFPSEKFSRKQKWYAGNSKEFSNRTACFANEYRLWELKERFTSNEEFKKTYNDMLERYVYDNAAFQILHNAFSSALHDFRTMHKPIQSMKYMEQEFINNWATRYCTYEKEDRENPFQLRINNVLRNSNLFQLTFDCDKKQSMNPLEKCIFWG